MRKKIVLLSLFIMALSICKAQKAVNFTCNDCNGKTHDLFKNLDSGKVVVIDWVMPCGSCIAPSKTTYNVVRSYDTLYPGKIVMFVADDYANTACPSIVSWTESNGMPNTIKFSNSSIKMMDYGSNGMPKVVIIGGKNHDVFFNENNSNAGNITKLQNALNSAIAATLSIENLKINLNNVEIAPNPANQNFNLKINLKNSEKYSIELTDIAGKTVLNILKDELINDGESTYEVNTDEIPNGVYLIKIYNNQTNKTLKIIINN